MRRTLLVFAGALTLLACMAAGIAQLKVVTFKDGREELIGKVTQKGDAYVVATSAGPIVTVPVSEVASVTEHTSPTDEYNRRLLGLEGDDFKGHFALAVWCEKHDLLKEALGELEIVLKLRPKHENASLLRGLITKKLAEADKGKGKGKTTKGKTVLAKLAGKLMGKEDIMRLRLAELRSRDKVGINFRNNVRRRYIESMEKQGGVSAQGFRKKTPAEQAVDILVHRPDDKALHADILVKTNPAFMSTFKSRIWPMIARNCATRACHGSEKGAGGLKLYNVAIKDDAVCYTNFYILNAYETARGRMIDRNQPSRSLLLQFGLPEKIARTRHPKPGPTKSMYRDVRSRKYKMMNRWIRSLLNPRPKYGLKFKAPGEDKTKPQPVVAPDEATTRPASASSHEP